MAITGTKGTRALASRYPVTSGLTAETTKTDGRQTNLVPELGTVVPKRYRL
jgi:hypothetical protein